MPLKSIKPSRQRLADGVYAQLRELISQGELGPDDHLIQEKLAAELQISRTPVREALMRLEQEGVLEVSGRGNFRLYRMTDDEVDELYQARAALEGQAARILTVRRNRVDSVDLRRTIEREERISDTTVRAYFEANRNIHRRFVELAGNRFLLEMFDSIWGRATAFQLFAAIENVDLAKSLGDHMTLVDVIESGDPMFALEAFGRHIQDGLDLQIEGLHAG